MMRYAVELGGRTVQVDLDSAADGEVHALVDGEPCDAEVSSDGHRLRLRLRERTLDLVVEWRKDTVVLHGPGGSVTARATSHRDLLAGRVAAAGAGPSAVRAPMPGRVVQVLVEKGARVEPGAAVVVVEAMKMENELRATGGGTVMEVLVEVGQTVEANAELIRIG